MSHVKAMLPVSTLLAGDQISTVAGPMIVEEPPRLHPDREFYTVTLIVVYHALVDELVRVNIYDPSDERLRSEVEVEF